MIAMLLLGGPPAPTWLVILYEPPLRVRRKAPPSLRPASLGARETAQLARILDPEAAR